MPTALKTDKPVTRETAAVYRGRPLIVELHPGFLVLRQKGLAERVTVDYIAALELGYKMLWRQAQGAKKPARRAEVRG
jgi:hypothetical protein